MPDDLPIVLETDLPALQILAVEVELGYQLTQPGVLAESELVVAAFVEYPHLQSFLHKFIISSHKHESVWVAEFQLLPFLGDLVAVQEDGLDGCPLRLRQGFRAAVGDQVVGWVSEKRRTEHYHEEASPGTAGQFGRPLVRNLVLAEVQVLQVREVSRVECAESLAAKFVLAWLNLQLLSRKSTKLGNIPRPNAANPQLARKLLFRCRNITLAKWLRARLSTPSWEILLPSSLRNLRAGQTARQISASSWSPIEQRLRSRYSMLMPFSFEKHCASQSLMAYWSMWSHESVLRMSCLPTMRPMSMSEKSLEGATTGMDCSFPHIIFNTALQHMFYFEYIVNRIDLNYTELKPFASLHFHEMTSRLELPSLRQGPNVIGLGKNLTLEISDMELASWFMEYALVLEFGGSLVKNNLYALLSLEKLEITDEIQNQVLVMDNQHCPQVEVKMDVSFRFRHVVGGGRKRDPMMIQTVAFRHQEGQENQQQLAQTAPNRGNSSKGSFLYGNKKLQARPNSSKKIPPRPASSKAIPNKQNSLATTTQGFYKKKPPIQPSDPQTQYEMAIGPPSRQLSFDPEPEQDPFGQRYYCPPTMEFTNQPKQPKAQPEVHYAPQVPQVVQMENYSFQNMAQIKEHKKPQPQKKTQAFDREEIKRLAEKELGKGNEIVVPVLENGKYVFKRLNEVTPEEMKSIFRPPAPTPSTSPTPIQIYHPHGHPQSQQQLHLSTPQSKPVHHSFSVVQKHDELPEHPSAISLSAQYPEDFESVSVAHSQSKHSSKPLRKKEEIVEESIYSEYSQNFDSFSQSQISKSNVKKSFEEIVESFSRSQSSYRK